jgi:hypothetical protein
MAGGIIGTGYGALDFLMAGGGGGSNSLFNVNPYGTGITGLPGISNLFGTSSSGSCNPYSGYSTSITAGQNSGSGYLASNQAHRSTQDASAVMDGTTQNNLFSNQNDVQKVNVFLDPQIGPGRSGTNMPVGGFLSSLTSATTGGQAAATDVANNQEIGLDQSAYAEEGGTAINNAYQVQNNVQIVNLYLDLNLQLPGMPTNPWMSSPWVPSSLSGYGVPQTNSSSPYGTGSGTAGSVLSTSQTTPQYDPSHVEPFKDFIYTTTDLEYSERKALRETLKEYANFFNDNGVTSVGRSLMTLAGAVGSAENIDRAERRFLRFEDAVSDMNEEEKAYFFEALNALADEVPGIVSDPSIAEDIRWIIYDLGEVVTGLSYDDLGYEDEVDVAA